MPLNTGASGGLASRFRPTEALPAPPALVAVQVSVLPGVSVDTVVPAQPLVANTGESGSENDQLTDGEPVYQPFAPSGAGGSTCPLTAGGVLSLASCTALSANGKPNPHSVSGSPAGLQSFVARGSVMIARTPSAPSAGLADSSSAATPAALGAAALVPKNGSNGGPRVVETPSAAAISGFARTSGEASRWPVASKKWVTGPRELNDSTSSRPGSPALIAATAIAPRAAAASGAIVLESVACSATENVEMPSPIPTYFLT